MKRRLRKKLGRKEFLKNGFSVSIILWLSKQEIEQLDLFWEKLVNVVEARGLLLLGVVDTFHVFTNYKTVPEPAATEADRRWLRDWLLEQPEVDGYWIGPLSSTWNYNNAPF
jgi:uncharacterized protein YggL (DUF469 family)